MYESLHEKQLVTLFSERRRASWPACEIVDNIESGHPSRGGFPPTIQLVDLVFFFCLYLQNLSREALSSS